MLRILSALGFLASMAVLPVAVLAGDAPPFASCSESVAMNCPPQVDTEGRASITCNASVSFVQQGGNTHLYGCELRIRPRIIDNLTVDIRDLNSKDFKVSEIKFNSEVQSGESQVVIILQRPVDITEPATVTANIEVGGKPVQ